MARRSTDWRSIVVQANPEHTRESRIVDEYEFTAPGGRDANDKTHKGGRRVFKGDYQERGPYRDPVVNADDLTWNGQPVDWFGDNLTWDD